MTIKPRSKRTLLSPKHHLEFPNKSELKRNFEEEELSFKEIYVPRIKDTESESGELDEDLENDNWYSPKNEYLSVLEKVDETVEEAKLDGDNTPRAEVAVVDKEEDVEVDSLSEQLSSRLDHILKEQSISTIMTQDEDDMKEVEKMIAMASKELEGVADENKKILSDLGEGGSAFKFNAKVDTKIMRELDEAECEAKQTAEIIARIKDRVQELTRKEKMTEVEAKELEELNIELKNQMIIFEQKTKLIEAMLQNENLWEEPVGFPATQHDEDILPKVVVCGLTENCMPKLLICDDTKSKCAKKFAPGRSRTPTSHRPKSGRRSKDSSCPPCFPCPPPSGCPPPSCCPPRCPPPSCPSPRCPSRGCPPPGCPPRCPPPGCPPRCPSPGCPPPGCPPPGCPPPGCPPSGCPPPGCPPPGCPPPGCPPPGCPPPGCPPPGCPPPGCPPRCPPPSCPPRCPPPSCPPRCPPCPPCPVAKPKMPCGPGQGICPANLEARLQEYSENTQALEQQLYCMEAEVKMMHQELMAVQKEREHLEHHRKMLCPATPCVMPPPCPNPSCPNPSGPCPMPICMPPPPCMAPPPCMERPSCETQLKELREQYKRLQDDFKSKLTEVAGLRADNEKLKDKTRAAEDAKKEAEKRARELEIDLRRLKGALKPKDGATREQLVELEGQLSVAKQRFREAQDELDELRLLVDDQQKQLDDYRNKYLEAQQTVEEQRRQIDLMEMENQRISEQVNLEIQRVKNQFQEKLQELMPLPDILKSTQLKLQEAQQMHLLAERNNEAIGRELEMYKDKVAAMVGQMEEVKSDNALGANATELLNAKVSELEDQLSQLQEMNGNLLNDLEKCQESCDEYEKLAEERLHEITQLEAQLDGLREETARQVARIKDRCEIVRRSMQKQIADLERQLAQSRAMAKSAQKDRDEIRQKMQAQINNLNENFEDAQMRIRNLQGHVNFMKNTYGDGLLDASRPALPEPCECTGGY